MVKVNERGAVSWFEPNDEERTVSRFLSAARS
jgi:hypothetical protein